MTTTKEHLPTTQGVTPRLVIKSFYREGPDDASVRLESVCDSDALVKSLRRDHGVCATHEAWPVVVMTEPEGDIRGNHIGTVAVAEDDEHRVQTIARAIRCLEAVRDGLVEAGHAEGR